MPETAIRPIRPGEHEICEAILRALPDWFGIEESLVHYVEQTKSLPTWIAETDSDAIGFLTIKRHSPHAGEIYCMAVRPAHHRHGAGRALVHHAERTLADDGALFLQVKTLGPSRPCEHYDRTRRFYEALGFVWLEEFPELWPGNPSLMLVKAIASSAAHHDAT